MKQLKKTLLTLVALFAMTTGAWADGIVCTASDLGKVLCTDGSIYENVSAATTAGKEAAAMIAYVDETNKNGLALALTDEYGQTWDNSSPSNNGKTAPEICSALNTSKAVTGGTWKLPSMDEWKQMFSANGGNEESYTGLNNALAAAGGESSKLLENEEYWSSTEVFDDAWLVNLSNGNANWDTCGKHYSRCIRACLAFDIASSSGPEVAWDKAENSGQFTMPGGNVTLEPEYYPQATLAFQGLTAAEDAAAKTEAPLAVLADGAVTGGTLMYYVATDKNFSQADAIALAETQWSADIPTAETIDAAGTYIMWYYIKGDAEHSDTDPIPLVVTLLPEPTYAVTFADDTAEPTLWKAVPAAGVTKGQTVTVTYTGTKKVLGVKAEKKAKAPASTPLDNTTTAWTAGTFAVPAGGLTYSDAITVSGDVTLTLTDGETLTLNKGISLASGATLTVEGNGTMNVNGTNNSTASTVAGSGTLVLTSGTLNAKGGNGQGVGDRSFGTDNRANAGGNAINGNVTVSGGTLTATGGNGGGVGAMSAKSYGAVGGEAISGSVTVTDGAVTATGGNGGSIGAYGASEYGGAGGAAIGGDATISGGTWTATNGTHGVNGDGQGGAGGKAVAGTVTDNR